MDSYYARIQTRETVSAPPQEVEALITSNGRGGLTAIAVEDSFPSGATFLSENGFEVISRIEN